VEHFASHNGIAGKWGHLKMLDIEKLTKEEREFVAAIISS
jgi:hypothetical protein